MVDQVAKAALQMYRHTERCIFNLLRNFYPGAHQEIGWVACDIPYNKDFNTLERSPERSIEDGFLWTAPRDRRSRERRLTRKFGNEKGYWKMLPVLKLLTCDNCGHAHEAGRLCPNCYSKNKDLTTAMQESQNATQGLAPIEHEVIPVFKGEKVDADGRFFKGMQIVEVPKDRPQWFSRRLTQKSNVMPSEGSSLKETSSLG
ncbi:large ribosomal subunit protein bL32m [Macrobrachium rosenbergii]|uniref:large ribosomal subunit protein bL32m n=1 Tax=Macrobrachium rosenbergii TaxID=79674 RepID=UPI0034D77277